MKLSKIIFIIAIFIFTANSVQAKKITPKRETVEWIDVWLPHTNDDKLPRVLLIGNSITRGYYPKVEITQRESLCSAINNFQKFRRSGTHSRNKSDNELREIRFSTLQ